jgi:hypothetical protein
MITRGWNMKYRVHLDTTMFALQAWRWEAGIRNLAETVELGD